VEPDHAIAQARARIDRSLIDRCTITFDPEGAHDDVLDTNPASPTFGRLSAAPGEPQTIAVDEPCRAKDTRSAFDRENEQEGRGNIVDEPYIVRLSTTAPHVPLGALITMTLADDPELQDAVLRVQRVVGATYRGSRGLVCQRRLSAEQRR
jgi:hypothetical protein